MQKKSSSSVRIYYPKFDREQLIQKLKERLDALEEKLPLQLVVLFGSYAKGNYTVASDIDLLIVYKGQERKDAYATIKKIFSIPLLEPHVYSEDQYERLKGNISKMIEDGVALFSKNVKRDV
jgi:predicted nucleotidyltransferase